jgi:hypothetical protein
LQLIPLNAFDYQARSVDLIMLKELASPLPRVECSAGLDDESRMPFDFVAGGGWLM